MKRSMNQPILTFASHSQVLQGTLRHKSISRDLVSLKLYAACRSQLLQGTITAKCLQITLETWKRQVHQGNYLRALGQQQGWESRQLLTKWLSHRIRSRSWERHQRQSKWGLIHQEDLLAKIGKCSTEWVTWVQEEYQHHLSVVEIHLR